MTLSDLTRSLPIQRATAQRAIARAFAPRTYRSTGEYAGVLSLGLIAGAALTLALAPKAREELRDMLSERVNALRNRATKTKKHFINGSAEERVNSPT